MFSEYFNSKVVAGCIEIYDEVIDNSKEIIDLCEKQNSWIDASIVLPDKEEVVDKSSRSNSRLIVNQFSYETDIAFYNLAKTVWKYCDLYAKKYQIPFSGTELMQVLKYSKGEYYEEHCDSGPKTPRVISALLYLNDVEEGGETEFTFFDQKIMPKAGRLVIFPSNYAYRHAAKPPLKGEKYVIAFWMMP
jgi:hypothetical protein